MTLLALYHSNKYFFPLPGESVLSHLLFVGIDSICVFGMIKRPRWFNWFFALLTLQQWYSHGGHLLHEWEAHQYINFADLAIVVLMPVIFVSLLRTRHAPS